MRSIREFFPDWSHVLLKVMHHPAGHSDLPAPPAWRALYVAAVSETDQQRIAARIDEAKRALVVRARELFQANGNHLQEQSAIDEALLALHALEQYTGHACIH